MLLTSRKRKVSINTPTLVVRNKISRNIVKLERCAGFVANDSSLHDHADDKLEDIVIKS